MESSSQSIRELFSVYVLPFDIYQLTHNDEDFNRQHRYVLLVQFISSCQVWYLKVQKRRKYKFALLRRSCSVAFLNSFLFITILLFINYEHIFHVRFLSGASGSAFFKQVFYRCSLDQL